MPSRRPIYQKSRSFLRKSKGTGGKIRIPQPISRPIHVSKRSVDNVETGSPPWFILHRRGPRRANVGEDPLEARAVSHSKVRGTLPERIVYKAFLMRKLVPGADFDFQSSEEGGRLELGGVVADFLFERRKIVVQVQGPTHSGYLRSQKDKEQTDQLKEYGYTIYELMENTIYDQKELENWMRSHIDSALNVQTRVFLDPLGAEMEIDQEDVAIEQLVQSISTMNQALEGVVA